EPDGRRVQRAQPERDLGVRLRPQLPHRRRATAGRGRELRLTPAKVRRPEGAPGAGAPSVVRVGPDGAQPCAPSSGKPYRSTGCLAALTSSSRLTGVV